MRSRTGSPKVLQERFLRDFDELLESSYRRSAEVPERFLFRGGSDGSGEVPERFRRGSGQVLRRFCRYFKCFGKVLERFQQKKWKGFGEVVEKVPVRFWGDVLESCWKCS